MTLTKKTTKKVAKKAPAKKAAKKATTKKATADSNLTPAQQAMQLLNKGKGEYSSEVIFDPNEPLATSDTWAMMPHPWNEISGVSGVHG